MIALPGGLDTYDGLGQRRKLPGLARIQLHLRFAQPPWQASLKKVLVNITSTQRLTNGRVPRVKWKKGEH